MKLEPLKYKNLPKYAAALAVAASAVLLTGCQTAGDVAIPDSQIASPDITEQVVPDESSSDEWVVLDGEARPDEDEDIALEGVTDVIDDCSGDGCETDASRFVTEGVAPMLEDESVLSGLQGIQMGGDDDAEPLTLEGDVAWIPDYQEATDNVLTQLTADRLQVYMDAFAAAGLPMESITEHFSHYGTNFTAVMENEERGIAVAFFDGTAEDQAVNMFDYLTNSRTSAYDWGCMLENINYKDEFSAMIFIDLSKEPEDAAAFAAQIAKDVTK